MNAEMNNLLAEARLHHMETQPVPFEYKKYPYDDNADPYISFHAVIMAVKRRRVPVAAMHEWMREWSEGAMGMMVGSVHDEWYAMFPTRTKWQRPVAKVQELRGSIAWHRRLNRMSEVLMALLAFPDLPARWCQQLSTLYMHQRYRKYRLVAKPVKEST